MHNDLDQTGGNTPDALDNAVLSRIKQTVERLIPAHWPKDSASQNKAFNLVGLMTGFTLLISLYVPVYFWQGGHWAAWACIFFLLVNAALMLAMRRGASFAIIGYCVVANVFLTAATTLWLQGAGPDSPQAVWIAFAPFAAAFVTGLRQALLTLVLSMAFLLGYIALKFSGSQFLYMAPVANTLTLNTIQTLLVLVGFSLLGLFFLLSQTLNDRALNLARQRADKLSQAKSEFLANMSHEIRTPMNAIVGMSYLALQGDLQPKPRSQIERVHRSAQSLLGIINDILDFSKIEAGKLAMESIDFSLNEILEHLANLLGPKSSDKGLELIFDIGADVPLHLVGDPLRLGQVLLNLGNNAVKFTHTGQILVQVEVTDPRADTVDLRFVVKDSGIGMDSEQLENLFKPFSQADTSTTRQFGGTGLGLAISKTLVELMQGRIWAESVVGKGSTFGFEVRLGVQANKAAAWSSPLSGVPVLLVDDHYHVRQTLARALQSFGMTVSLADSAELALYLAQQAHHEGSPFALVLLDRHMPQMNGAECAERMRQMALSPAPTIVMMTTHGSPGHWRVDNSSLTLIRATLTKPVLTPVLLETIQSVLGLAGQLPARLPTLTLESEKQAQAVAQLRGARVLLVEDNAINQELVLDLFEYAGLTVVVVNHGQEALDLLEHDKAFDGILMDCQMPVMDGYTTTRHIRQNPTLATIPVLAMTANAMIGDREAAIAAGMNDHISKPLDPEKMFVTMARWIKPGTGVALSNSPAKPGDDLTVPALPAIKGIDQTLGLRISNGKPALYHRLLAHFATTYARFGIQFAQALESADTKEALRFAHSLKGNAANLGMVQLAARAGDLELACKNQSSPGETEAHLQKVLVELEPVIAALQAVVPSDKTCG